MFHLNFKEPLHLIPVSPALILIEPQSITGGSSLNIYHRPGTVLDARDNRMVRLSRGDSVH